MADDRQRRLEEASARVEELQASLDALDVRYADETDPERRAELRESTQELEDQLLRAQDEEARIENER